MSLAAKFALNLLLRWLVAQTSFLALLGMKRILDGALNSLLVDCFVGQRSCFNL
jgi:hypothetical protein